MVHVSRKKAQDDVYNGNVMEIYKDMFDGAEIGFDLTDRLDSKDVFEFDKKTLNVSTRQKAFPRMIKFDLDTERVSIHNETDVKKYIDDFNINMS